MTFEQWWEINGVGYSSYEDFAKDAWEAGYAAAKAEENKE